MSAAGACSSCAIACTAVRTAPSSPACPTTDRAKSAAPASATSATARVPRASRDAAVSFAASLSRSTHTIESWLALSARAQADPISPAAPTTTATSAIGHRLAQELDEQIDLDRHLIVDDLAGR